MRDLRHEKARAAGDLADWLVHLDLRSYSTRTLYGYTRTVAPLLRANPELRFDEFTYLHIRDQLRLVPQRSRHISRSVYNQWFEWGLREGRIDRTPMARVEKFRHPQRQPKDIFSEAEVSLLCGLPIPDGPLWTIMFYSGCRRAGARRLTLGDVNFERARITLREKGRGGAKVRIVPVPPWVLVALEDLRILDGLNPQDHLWYSRRRNGMRLRKTPIADTTFERWYSGGIKAAGVRYLNPHQTRHTYGDWLRQQGYELEERQVLMGHENVQTTQHYYGRVTVEDVARKMAAKVDET